MTGKIKIIIVSAILGVLVLGGGITGTVLGVNANKKENVVTNSFLNMVEDFFDRHEVMHVREVLKNGSIEYSGTEAYEDSDMDNIMEAPASGKIYFNLDGLVIEDLSLSNNDKTYKANAYIGQDKIYVDSDEILGGAYGITKKDCLAKLEEAHNKKPEDGKEPLIDDETYLLLKNILKVYTNDVTYKDTITELEDGLKDIVDHVSKIFKEKAVIELSKEKVYVHGELEKSRCYTITFDALTSLNIAKDILVYLDTEDKVIPDILNHHPELIDLILYLVQDDEEEEKINVLDEYHSALKETIKDLDENIADLDTTDDDKIVLKLYSKTGSSTLMRMDCFILDHETNELGDAVFKFDCGKDGIKKADLITLTVDDITYRYEIKEKGKNKFELSINADEEKDLLHFVIDKKEEKFNLSIAEEMFWRGKFTQNNKHSYTFSEVEYEDEDGIVKTNFKLTFDEKAKLPKPLKDDEIKDAFSIDEAAIEKLEEFLDLFFGNK